MFDLPEKTYFISGIDTGIGKTVATGALARQIQAQGKTVLTQKPIQTGCTEMAEDITVHRAMQGIGLTAADDAHITCTYLLPYPASPHLSARLAQMSLDLQKIDKDTTKLQQMCDLLLIEGAGGLMVPMTDKTLTAEFIRERDYPLILITCGRLGSINHTLLSLAYAAHCGIRIAGVVYNRYFDTDDIIAADTRNYLLNHVHRCHPDALWLDLSADTNLKTV